MNRLYIVVPCYKEEAVLPETSKRLKEKLTDLIKQGRIADNSRVLFVDDGSSDRTWEIITQLHRQDPMFSGVKLSRNRGHQNALLCGLDEASLHADTIISMDADLQDDIGAVDKMLDEYDKGCEVVYGVRSSRKKDTFFKRFTAQGFYRFMQAMGVDIVYNHADYRLLSQRAAKELLNFPEVNLFLRGMVPLVGFKHSEVTYERGERFAGESKYPLKKMLAFAFDGITSFSVKPIRLILSMGVAIFVVSVIMLLVFIIQKLLGHTVAGWASTICSIWALGGIQMMSLGIVGEYIGKIYNETKRRPRYIKETVLDQE
ncbi:MAG: glycosyltransferase family 2 protein [Clostridia bacterium]|nr:glycosyltransferase family 2 protein [Clostridia bacterium]